MTLAPIPYDLYARLPLRWALQRMEYLRSLRIGEFVWPHDIASRYPCLRLTSNTLSIWPSYHDLHRLQARSVRP